MGMTDVIVNSSLQLKEVDTEGKFEEVEEEHLIDIESD